MNVDPRQNDPQYQSPLAGDSEQASQFGMRQQADAPAQQGFAGTVPGTRSIDPNSIVPGADVYGSDDKRLGTVQEVYDDSFLVQKGIFFVHDYFIPLAMVTRVAPDRIDLGISADDAKSQDWSSRPGIASLGRGVQADTATDTQRGDLNTQNNVNPSALGADAMGDRTAGTTPTPGGGVVMPNQPTGTGMGMGMGSAMNPSGPMPTQYDAGQYDQTMNADQAASGGAMNSGDMVPENLRQGGPAQGDQMRGGARSLGGDPRGAGGLTGDPYQQGALSADSMGGMQGNRGPGASNLSNQDGTPGASLSQDESDQSAQGFPNQ